MIGPPSCLRINQHVMPYKTHSVS